MEDSYIVTGGYKLKGEVILSGAKNIALKTIIAALLFKGDVILKNIPRIRDVDELIHLVHLLGVKTTFIENNTLIINSDNLKMYQVDLQQASKIRVSFMLFAPLLYKFGRCHIPNPGGCRIGARPIDRVVDGLKNLGVEIKYNHETGYYDAILKTKPNGKYRFDKISHTSTELLILMSVFGNGKIIIDNTALEPEIDDLIAFLNAGGAKIYRNNSQIIIEGVNSLKQNQPYTIATDRNEAITYAVMAISTKGEVMISQINKNYISKFIDKLTEAGAGVEDKHNGSWHFFYKGNLKAVNIETQPHPGFMTDWQPNWAVLMTQAEGESIIQERVFENRFSYVDELRKLGAELDFVKIPTINPSEYFFFNFDPLKKYNQAISIKGPQILHSGVLNIADLRAGATLAIGALIADGESIISGASILERGYENFIGKVQGLGGRIKKI